MVWSTQNIGRFFPDCSTWSHESRPAGRCATYDTVNGRLMVPHPSHHHAAREIRIGYSEFVSLRTGNRPASASRTIALTSSEKALRSTHSRKPRSLAARSSRDVPGCAPNRSRRLRRARSVSRPHSSDWDHPDAASGEARRVPSGAVNTGLSSSYSAAHIP